MKTPIGIRWLIRRLALPLGVNLAITGGIALGMILDIVFK